MSPEPLVAASDSLLGAVVCEPGRAFCDGAHLFSCSRSGRDAFSLGACAGGSDNNPVGCFTTDCSGGATACCRPAKATCDWSFTSPAISGQTYVFDEKRDKENYCVAPSTCDQNSFTFYIAPPKTTGSCPEMVGRSVHVIIGRPLPLAGQVVTLPDSRVIIHSGSATIACSAWRGTLIVHSDVPSWRVSIDATCSNPGSSDIRIVGSASGDV
ncbi:collagen-like protein [Corallococcus exiguus]|uniref:collagen-like protein n=1 Tax=Corallococcus TaxID=83461 RepID=UPI000EE82DE7|nr:MULTISPECIES: collagen-like protein [Corallococcus]NNC07315.1 collagen-like protein [Corallococcus exiguus]NPC50567.1 collagen-like protein [Corallococcus exiguus]RKH84793.1 collagen-like protein [Corallococcus sp. AB032C]